MLNFQLMLESIELRHEHDMHLSDFACIVPFCQKTNTRIQSKSSMKHLVFLVLFGTLCVSESSECLRCLWIYLICGKLCACIFMSLKKNSHYVPTNVTLLRSLRKGTCINTHERFTKSIKQTPVLTFKQILLYHYC